MPRLALLVLAGALAGCASTTHVVDRADAASVAQAHEALVGRAATLDLASGERPTGLIQFIRSDSVAWDESDQRRAAPTAAVYAITADNRTRRVVRGALLGLGVGVGASLAYVQGLPVGNRNAPFDLSGLQALDAAYVASFYLVTFTGLGAALGALGARRVDVVFTDGPPGPPR